MNTQPWCEIFEAVAQTPIGPLPTRVKFKTEETGWIQTESSVIIPVSLHSAFHDEVQSDVKMNTFLSIIKREVKGKITLLMTEKAHLHARSLSHNQDLEKTLEDCVSRAHQLIHRYQPYLEHCHITDWSYLTSHKSYADAKKFTRFLFETDVAFRECLHKDAELTYTPDRMKEFSEALYIEKTIEDGLEQCAALVPIAKRGNRFIFYPGHPPLSMRYFMNLMAPEIQITWVCVSIYVTQGSLRALNQSYEKTSL